MEFSNNVFTPSGDSKLDKILNWRCGVIPRSSAGDGKL